MSGEKRLINNIDDIVFESRNKEYGAYFLRKSYARNMTRGIMIALSFTALVFLYQTCNNKKQEEPLESNILYTDEAIYEVSTEIPIIDMPAPQKASTPTPPEPIVEPVTNTENVKVVKNEVLIQEKPKELETTDTKVEPIQNSEVKEGSVDGTDKGVVESLPTNSGGSSTGVTSKPDKMPQFPGGKEALNMFLTQNIIYPKAARESKTEGQVILKLVVDKDGSIIDIKIVKGIGKGCDEEALRVVQQMPNWVPGMAQGNPVKVQFSLPINFKLKK